MVQGVPIRMEIGPKDLEAKTVVLVRRDVDGPAAKETVAWTDVVERVPELLEQIQVLDSNFNPISNPKPFP